MALSPMMRIYLETKEQYKDCILFYRLGDFYEMFFEDALLASKELQLTLTGKDCGLEERAPMCGVPYHAADGYINKLVAKGYKVAIGEQMEDAGTSRGLVRREVIRVVTPGTNFDIANLDESRNNYIMCAVFEGGGFGMAISDITTGDFYLTQVAECRTVFDEINKFKPTEIICNDAFMTSGIDMEEIQNRLSISVFPLAARYFDCDNATKALLDHFKIINIAGLGISDYSVGIPAAGALMKYFTETQKSSLSHITKITPYSTGKFMIIDAFTRRNLELTETLREKQKKGSLLWVIDKTKTAMGARLLRRYIEQPLLDIDEIKKRHAIIEAFNESLIIRDEIREYLNSIYDLERLTGKIAYRSATPRDMLAFKNSLMMLPHIKRLLSELNAAAALHEIIGMADDLSDIAVMIDKAIMDEPPLTIKEGGLIKDGYNEDVDRYRLSKTEGKNWIAELELEERERTGVKSLKIKYNKVFGYCIEITNSYKNSFEIPEDYTRKQTLVNAERYTTPKLKELEDIILGAEDRLFSLEYSIFTEIREKIASQILRIQNAAREVAYIDVFSTLAYVAQKNNYVRPSINKTGIINIKAGRHPVVEQVSSDLFVENDVYLDGDDSRVSIITGPNMAGKSTYMRQTALIVLMAQTGCYVPAEMADICICDRIFTRVGASDDLASGQSTFMVEMTEVSNILRNATPASLLILDEIGRGTSTFDGLSIAWAVIEHISNVKFLGAKTLFATHYHELTELENTLPGVRNYCIAVRERGDDIVFLRKIIRGGADKSYGIQVAKLAGVPQSITDRAKELLAQLIRPDVLIRTKEIAEQSCVAPECDVPEDVLPENAFSKAYDEKRKYEEDVLESLRNLNIGNITPLEAINILYGLQDRLKNK